MITVGVVLILAGAMIFATNNFFPVKAVKEIDVNVSQTDWYGTEYFQALVGDSIKIHVDVSGGSAKLVVRDQGGQIMYGEVQGVILYYDVPVGSAGVYHVEIWTRAIPFPSTYVNLAGTVILYRVFNNSYPIAYVADGTLLFGILILVGGVLFFAFERQKIGKEKEELKNSRICPKCNRRVPVEKPVCPYCGLDITRTIQCEYCHGFYDRALQKCPHCGAKKTQ
jgi:RNA polymerase subunit RPABC4/transcription elongation factor Spt4